jgi:hypothetical protein
MYRFAQIVYHPVAELEALQNALQHPPSIVLFGHVECGDQTAEKIAHRDFLELPYFSQHDV